MQRTTLLALAVRILIALSTRTFFQPDEYFQSLEPAHHLVFGYGKLTWEWLAPYPIRSILYPALNVPLYWIIKVLGIDHWDWLLIASPKVLHGSFAALTDVWVCEIARKVIGERYVTTVLFISLTSFFHALSLSRSLSNSLETSLTTIALSQYPWDLSTFNQQKLRLCLVFAAFACAVRPTNAVIWAFLLPALFWYLRSRRTLLFSIGRDAFGVASLALALLLAIDSVYYGRPTFTPVNFLRTNISSVSLFYGRSPWHYYLTQALPILCTTSLPFVLHGAWTTMKRPSGESASMTTILRCVIWTIGIYSMAGHKEWRFLHPLLPLLHVFAAKSVVDLHSGHQRKPLVMRGSPTKELHSTSRFLPIQINHLCLLLVTVPVSIYVVVFYCDAPISVMSYLRNLSSHELQGSVGFLMPCHSTPWQSHIHRKELAVDDRMWGLGCEPPLGNQSLLNYRDQTDVFYESPVEYLRRYFPDTVDPSFPPSPLPSSFPGVATERDEWWDHRWPLHLVMFGELLDDHGMRQMLLTRAYQEVWKSEREWEGEGKRKGGVRVWKYQGNRWDHGK